MKNKLYFGLLVAATMMSCSDKDLTNKATGTFEATEITISAKASGQIERLNIVEGQQLKQGELVGLIDATQLQLKRNQLATSKKKLNASRQQIATTQRQMAANRAANDSRTLDLGNQIASLQQQIANLKREKQRFQELLNDGAATRKQVDDIEYNILVLQKQLVATQEQLASANESLSQQSKGINAQIEGLDAQRAMVKADDENLTIETSQIDDQISNTNIVSPINGIVLEKYMEQNEFAVAGKPLFKMADTNQMIMRAYITSEQLMNVKVGQIVKVFADYGNEQRKEYKGKITWISNKSEFTPKTILTDDERADLVYAIKIRVKNDGYIKIGMYGEVELLGEND